MLTIEDAQTYGRIWDLPVTVSQIDDDDQTHDKIAVPLGRNTALRNGGITQLCAWSAPTEIGYAAAGIIERGRSQAAVYRLPPHRIVILGRHSAWLPQETRVAFAAVGIHLHDDDLAWLPQPGVSDWVTYSSDLTRLPGMTAVELALKAAVISRQRNTACTSLLV